MMLAVSAHPDHPVDVGTAEGAHSDRYLRPIVLRYAAQEQAKSVLDLGCGGGFLGQELSRAGLAVTGIDVDVRQLERARQLVPTGKFHFLNVQAQPEELAETGFDLVISTEVIEHLCHPRKLLRFALDKLKPRGLLLVSTPYHGYLKNVLIATLGQWDQHHTTPWDGGHVKFWSRATLSEVMQQEGFELIAFHGAGRCPLLWKSMVLVVRKPG